MSNFLDLNFTFTYINRNYKFVIDPTNNATSMKNKTLKLTGYVDVYELAELSRWLYSSYNTKSCKIEGKTPNGEVLGCFLNTLSFTAKGKIDYNTKELDDFEKGGGKLLWKAHLVINYDKILDNK